MNLFLIRIFKVHNKIDRSFLIPEKLHFSILAILEQHIQIHDKILHFILQFLFGYLILHFVLGVIGK